MARTFEIVIGAFAAGLGLLIGAGLLLLWALRGELPTLNTVGTGLTSVVFGLALLVPASRWKLGLFAATILLGGLVFFANGELMTAGLSYAGAFVAVLTGIVGYVLWDRWRKRELLQALARLRADDVGGALELARHYIREHPRCPNGHLVLTCCLCIQEDWHALLDAIERADEKCSPFPAAYPFSKVQYFRGVANWRLGDARGALPLIEAALEREPKVEVMMVATRGLVLAELGRLGAARECLEVAEEHYPAVERGVTPGDRERFQRQVAALRAKLLDDADTAPPANVTATGIRAERTGR